MSHGAPMMESRGVSGARAESSATPPAPCPPFATSHVAAGRQIFNRTGNCYTCHGLNAVGTTMAPTLGAHAWLKIDGSYSAIVSLVESGVARPIGPFTETMPPRGGADLSVGQVCDVAAYVYSLSH